MKVYTSKTIGITSYYSSYTEVLEEFKMFLDTATVGDSISYGVMDITEEQFNKLTESKFPLA